MLKTYLKSAFRNIIRYKINSLINITGLATGIAACMLIFIYVNNELSFDRFHAHSKNIYRLVFDYKFPDKLDHLAVAAPVAGNLLQKDYPEVLNHTSISPYSSRLLVKYKNQNYYEENIYVADSTFFTLFDYKLLSGDKNLVLKDPNTVVICKSTAEKYFGKENPVGKTLEFDNNDGTFSPYKVTGVFEDIPVNSHLAFSSLVSYKTLEVLYGTQGLNSWHNAGSFIYLNLKPGTDVNAFETKITHLYDKYAEEYKNVKASISMHLEPLTDIHLRSDRLFDAAIKGNESYVYSFAVVALFLLLIACINYINLATAQGKIRMKEVGVRKVIGAGRTSLIVQFVIESGLIVISSIAVSLLIILISLPVFNSLANLKLNASSLFTSVNVMFLFTSGALIIALAGIYPAFYLSSVKPALAIKSNSTSGEKGITLRKFLVVTQFTITITLISATLVVRSQVNFMLEHDPGFNSSNVMALRFQDTLTASAYFAIKGEMLKLNGVQKVAQTSGLPGDAPDRKITRVEGQTKSEIIEIPLEPIWVDYDYFDLMQVHLKEGRLFDRNRSTDPRQAFVVNESAAKKFNWQSSLGKQIIWGRNPRTERNGEVVGVVRDVFTGSLKNELEPILFICDPNPSKAYNLGFMLIRINAANQQKIISEIKDTWARFDKIHPPEYKFLDENIAGLYTAEKKTNTLFEYLTFLTIVIACLGLLGLVSFSVSQRVKEIGIRKVLGSGVLQVTTLLSKDLLKLVLLSFVLAVPLGWYVMQLWLQDFAFRIEIKWWMFAIAGFTALFIAALTVSVKAGQAALANPVKSLRTE